jgi:SAM-dependent methyltransferase
MVERALRPTIPTLTLVADAVSQAVQAQYEENPYPRWVRTWQHDQPRPLQAVLQSLSPPLALGGWVAPEQPEILIAGCGTGEHAIGTASRFIHGRILAVDLSRASLSYALRKTRERGITTIDYAQADILALGNLDQRFDLIESAGVLHHMADPMAGWRVLAGLLKPGGLMAIALYSEAARQPVVRARARIAQQGWSSSPESMRRFRQTLIQGASEPDLDWLRSTRDFYSLSECRDLLFHIQEHRFTIPGIESALQELGLRFLGFEVPASLWAQFQAFDPDPAATTSLAAWDRFESHHPEAFKGMYQFWCQKI